MADAELAYVQEGKITAYLLEPAHPEGGDKAAFLIRFSFRLAAPEELRDALLRHAREGTVAAIRATPFGPQYAVEGPLRTPDARPGLPYGMVKEGGGGGATLRHRLPDEEEVREMIREFDRAILTKDIPEEGLKAGDVGTVVDVHEDGAGYSLEFFTLNGETLAVVTVTADAVKPVGERQIAHARDL